MPGLARSPHRHHPLNTPPEQPLTMPARRNRQQLRRAVFK
jgi:hypothetical protein